MVKILREADKTPIADVAKKHGISEQTIYLWRKKFGTMSTNDAKRLKALELENNKLKKLLRVRPASKGSCSGQIGSISW